MIQRVLCFFGFHGYGRVICVNGMSRRHYGRKVTFRKCPHCDEVYED